MPITYKCPSCGSVMEFDSTSGMLKCVSCGYETSADSGQNDEQKTREQFSQNMDNMKIYHCQSCGAELVADEYTSATFCSFCGNPTLVEDRLSGEFQPETIIPFKINREQAVDMYRKWVKKGPLTPSELKRASTIEKISGVYVPFWLYSYAARTQMEAKAERVRTTRKGDTEYVYTDHFHIHRDISADFERIPADASKQMPDDDMDKLEPYDYSAMVPFSMPYLSGFLSERYNFTPDEIESRAHTRADRYITNLARDTITGYSSVTVLSNHIDMNSRGSEYSLLPVWNLSYRYKGKNYQFMINGQTGKIVAERPISIAKAFAYGAAICAGTFLITMIGGLLLL
ncbi:MAG: hypothetical protein ACI4E1_11570 [Lachnospira sp.]